MELGALVCIAGTPRCGACPVRDRCAWRLSGSPPELDRVWDDAVQRSRCLDSLLVDGLVVQTDDGRFTLPT
jgi:A/G-specific adenine glycosylase